MKEMSGISKGKYLKKITGGKLIKVYIEVEGDKIRSIKFLGDYFVYPEEIVERVEKEIEGKSVEEGKDIIRKNLKNVEMVGISVEDFVEALMEAYRSVR